MQHSYRDIASSGENNVQTNQESSPSVMKHLLVSYQSGTACGVINTDGPDWPLIAPKL